MKRIYIAGPYSTGEAVLNVRAAIDAAHAVADAGFAPFIPHLCHFWHMVYPRPYQDWIAMDLEWVKACDGVLRLPGHSSGADGEVELAERLGIPVFHSVMELRAWV